MPQGSPEPDPPRGKCAACKGSQGILGKVGAGGDTGPHHFSAVSGLDRAWRAD